MRRRTERWRAIGAAVLIMAMVLTAIGRDAAAATPAAAPGGDLVFILDASGSMWGQVRGEAKIAVARRVLKEALAGVPEATAVGLVAYGHRSKEDCADIEVIAAPGAQPRPALAAKIDALQPKGKTPITAAVTQVFEALRTRERPATVVLVSDGIETCGGDPCAAVRAAREAGIAFVLHVVGFDVGDVDVAQLECAAQAGGGLYLPAADADQLAAALAQAVALTPDTPAGRLVMAVRADGQPADGLIEVFAAGTQARVAHSRSYTGADTNPRAIPLPDGTYDVTVQAVAIEGRPVQTFERVVIADGATVERAAEFGSGTLRVGVTRNGAPSDASVTVYRAGTKEVVANTRTYTAAPHNPTALRVPAGTYDVVVASVEVAGRPTTRWDGLTIAGGATLERQHDFGSGTVRIGVRRGAELIDATIGVYRPGDKATTAAGRSYTNAKSNPRAFDVPPGRYLVKVRPVKPPGLPEREAQLDVPAGGTVEHIFDYAP